MIDRPAIEGPVIDRPAIDLSGDDFQAFWRERHLCTLTTLRPDGTPHVVPVGVTLDAEAGVVRVITSGDSAKARQVRAAGVTGLPAAVCQVDGRRWSTLEGIAVLRDDATSVRDAEHRYGQRYRVPRENPKRVVLEITITRRLGSVR
jgi:PPOX class probable F420-dependent enzyme